MGQYRNYGVLPGFDTMGEPVYEGALAAKISAAQAISAQAQAYMKDPVVKGAVDGLEQAITSALKDLRSAVGRVKTVNAGVGDTGAGTDKPLLSQFQYSGGGGQFQAALLAWRKRAGNDYYMPDIEDYRYPGGGGQYDEALTAWKAAARNAASAARDNLSSLLDQYASKVPAAFKADQDLAQAQTVAQTVTTTASSTETAAKSFVAQQNLQQAIQKATAAAAAVAHSGPSPLIIAAVAVPVLGIIAWALTRKKGGSVAGYRRRRRSRR